MASPESGLSTSTIRVVSRNSMDVEVQQGDDDEFSAIINQYVDNKAVKLGGYQTHNVEEQGEVEHRGEQGPEFPADFA